MQMPSSPLGQVKAVAKLQTTANKTTVDKTFILGVDSVKVDWLGMSSVDWSGMISGLLGEWARSMGNNPSYLYHLASLLKLNVSSKILKTDSGPNQHLHKRTASTRAPSVACIDSHPAEHGVQTLGWVFTGLYVSYKGAYNRYSVQNNSHTTCHAKH